jgi:hypothetical protein
MDDPAFVVVEDYIMKEGEEEISLRRFRVGSETRHGVLENIVIHRGKSVELEFKNELLLEYSWNRVVKFSNKFERGI